MVLGGFLEPESPRVAVTASVASESWEALQFSEARRAAKLRVGESASEWWHSGAQRPKKALHRMLMAPTCIDHVKTADAWTFETFGNGALVDALIAVKFTDRETDRSGLRLESFTATGPSKNKALQQAALKANLFIASLVPPDSQEHPPP